MRHFAKLLIMALVASYTWRCSREFVGMRLTEVKRSPFTETSMAGGLPAGEHYSPAENLERLDYEAIQGARHSLAICIYSFTDRRLAEAVLDAARRGVEVRLYRDGEEYEQEQKRAVAYSSTTDMLRGQANIHIRVKAPSATELMHLKAFLADGTLLRDGSAKWSRAGELREDNQIRFTTARTEIEQFEHNFQQLWNRPNNLVVQ